MDFKIKAKQDFIFFGVRFVEELISEQHLQCDWFVKDGGVVLKDQACCLVSCENQIFVNKLLGFLCYLSGVVTLVRCFVKNTSISVVASSTSHSIHRKNKQTNTKSTLGNILHDPKAKHLDFSNSNTKENQRLSYWEQQAIEMGGGQIEPELPNRIFQDEKSFFESLKQPEKLFCFDTSYLSLSKIKSLIKELPDSSVKGIYGNFKPENCKTFSDIPVQIVWSSLLQGHFPRVQMVRENEKK